MASPFPPGPVCPPLASPVVPDDAEAFVVPTVLTLAEAEAIAKKTVFDSFFRPSDIQRATLAPCLLLQVPFWRVHVTVDGFHFGLSSATGADGRLQWILPTGGARHRDAVLLVTARRLFPFEPQALVAQNFLAAGPFGEAMGRRATSSFEIELDEMVPRASAPALEGEIIQPDVTREAAKAEASERVLRAVRPISAIYARYTPDVKSVAFCCYPLFVTRYDYAGEATRRPGETYHVSVSGRTGKVVGGHHPSAVRAFAAKVRRFVTF